MATPPSPDTSRASREAANAQSAYWRASQRPSIVWPLVLIVAGILALLVETGRLSLFHFWGWYVRWWPLFLIAVGTVSLAEWWFDRENPYVRRYRYGGIVALLFVMALVGYTDRGLNGLRHFDGPGGDDPVLHLFGEERSSGFNLNQQIPAGANLNLQLPRGDVTVTRSEDSQIHLQANEKVYAGNDGEARRAFDALRPRIEVQGKNVSLQVASQGNGRADLTIAIPGGTAATIMGGHGDVTVQGVDAPVDVTAETGDVKLVELKSTAHVRMHKGDLIANSIAGDLSLEGRMDDVVIADVGGRALLEGDFFGDMHISRVASEVKLHSSRTVVDLGSLPGRMSLDSDDLQVNKPAGSIRIITKAKDIECTGVPQNADIENEDGDIVVSTTGQPGAIHVENGNGDIELTLPKDAHFTLNAVAKNGKAHSDFELSTNKTDSGESLSGSIGSGAGKIELIADHGDIHIGKSDTPDAAGASPEGGSGKSIRRLRIPSGGAPSTQSQ